MRVRVLPFILVAFAVVALSMHAKKVLPVASIAAKEKHNNQQEKSMEQASYFDMEYFISGQALANHMAGQEQAQNSLLKYETKHTSAVLLPSVNVEQLVAVNTKEERKRKSRKRRIRRFIDRMPSVTDNNAAKVFFRGKEKSEIKKQVETILAQAKKNKGVPYVWGGSGRRGFDCSGFTQYAFRSAGITLPRQSHLQSKLGKVVPLSQAQPGDMVFFGRKRGDTYKTNHTGIVLENTGGKVKIIHSTRRGVVIDRVMEINSYKRRFLFVKRMF